MMATTHGIVGATIAMSTPNPILAGGLIIMSHYLLDLIPHWDFGTDWKKRSVARTGTLAIVDTICSYGITYLLFSSLSLIALATASHLSPLSLFWAVSLANLPDWLEAPYFMFFASKNGHHNARGGSLGQFLGKIHGFQENYLHTTTTFFQGIATQIGVVVFFLLLLSTG